MEDRLQCTYNVCDCRLRLRDAIEEALHALRANEMAMKARMNAETMGTSQKRRSTPLHDELTPPRMDAQLAAACRPSNPSKRG